MRKHKCELCESRQAEQRAAKHGHGKKEKEKRFFFPALPHPLLIFSLILYNFNFFSLDVGYQEQNRLLAV